MNRTIAKKILIIIIISLFGILSIFGQANDDANILKVGLQAWRAPREIGSCNTCHSPDAFDLSVINISDENLRRRATGDGATAAEADAIVNLVQLNRRKFKITKLLDPVNDRPFQPGGKVLVGANPAERDIAFGRSLKSKIPTLMGDPIDSEEKAILAARELMAINLRGLPIGIEYPRWSEDHFHGVQRGNMNEWIPDISRLPIAAKEAEWLALQDKYIADPSEKNFWAMYDAVVTLTAPQFATSYYVDFFERDRMRSHLIGQHLLREKYLPTSTSIVRGHTAFAYRAAGLPISTKKWLPNPWWEVGDFARVMLDNGSINARTNLTNLKYPDRIVNRIDPVLTGETMQTAIRMPWFWLGFTLDPGLRRINGSNSTLVGEYLTANLYENKMFVHNDFMSITRLVSSGFDQDSPSDSRNAKGELTQFFDGTFSYTVGYGRAMLRQGNFIEANGTSKLNPEQIELHKTLMGNSFRMSLYLMRAQLQRRGGTFTTPGITLTSMKEFFDFFEPTRTAQNNALITEVTTLVAAAKTATTSDENLFATVNDPLFGANVNVSAAHYRADGLATEGIASAFGKNLALGVFIADELPLPKNLGGTVVKIKDSTGVEKLASLFYVSPTQVNYLIPKDVAPGQATVTIISSDGLTSKQSIVVAATAPGLFSADSSGAGFAAANVTRVKANGAQINEPIVRYDTTQNKFVAVPLNLGAEQGDATDQVYLILYGTGIRNRSTVSATIGGVKTNVAYAGAQGFYEGVDQINLQIPRSLIGKSETTVDLTIDGKISNAVKIHIQ